MILEMSGVILSTAKSTILSFGWGEKQAAVHLPSTACVCDAQTGALSEQARERLRALAQQLGLTDRLVLHEEAVGTRDNVTIRVNTAGRSRCGQLRGVALVCRLSLLFTSTIQHVTSGCEGPDSRL